VNYPLGEIVGASELTGECLKIDLRPPYGFGMIETIIAISIVVRYRVLGFEESGVKILVYLMRLGNAIEQI
jgi:hypothetical protein